MKTGLSGKIVFASGKTGDYDLWTFDLDTGAIAQVTRGACWNDKPRWSPDGEWIVFTSNRGSIGQEIFRVDAAGGEPTQLTRLGKWADAPVYNPDGTRIAFISNEAGNNDVWIMDADGGNRTQVTVHPGSDDHVCWTPDGAGLLFSSDRGDGDADADIWHIDLRTQVKTQLNADRGADITPVPSPDGTLIVFCSNRQHKPDPKNPFSDRDKDIWLMAADGTTPVRLTENQGADYGPCWSPDGQRILYTAGGTNSDCHLRMMNVSDVTAAFATGNATRIEQAAAAIRHDAVEFDRSPLKADIGAVRHATILTCWLPDKWMESCYPPGYFGLERNPDWVAAPQTADRMAVHLASDGLGNTL